MVPHHITVKERPREICLLKFKNRMPEKGYHYCLQLTEGREKRRQDLLGGVY